MKAEHRAILRQAALDIHGTMGAAAGIHMCIQDVLVLLDDADKLARLMALIETGSTEGLCLSPADADRTRRMIDAHRTQPGGNEFVADHLERLFQMAEQAEKLYEETRELRGIAQYWKDESEK